VGQRIGSNPYFLSPAALGTCEEAVSAKAQRRSAWLRSTPLRFPALWRPICPLRAQETTRVYGITFPSSALAAKLRPTARRPQAEHRHRSDLLRLPLRFARFAVRKPLRCPQARIAGPPSTSLRAGPSASATDLPALGARNSVFVEAEGCGSSGVRKGRCGGLRLVPRRTPPAAGATGGRYRRQTLPAADATARAGALAATLCSTAGRRPGLACCPAAPGGPYWPATTSRTRRQPRRPRTPRRRTGTTSRPRCW
jgi:hypothetical protein